MRRTEIIALGVAFLLVSVLLIAWSRPAAAGPISGAPPRFSKESFPGAEPPAHFAPPHSDIGLDSDADGIYNYFAFDVNISVAEAKTYYLQGYLHDPDSVPVAPAFNRSYLPVGLDTVRLVISGARFLLAGVNGPYTLRLELYDWATFEIYDYDNHTTGDYRSADFEPPVIDSPFSASAPVIDGTLSPGEWADANVENLSHLSGNFVPGLFLVKDDNERLYVAYDATGDTTQEDYDTSSIGFDTNNDGVPTDKHEDQFAQGGWPCHFQAHLIYSAIDNFWVLEDCPYDSSLPNEAGLASAWGFGTSDNSATAHRVYEYAIPFPLILVKPGDTVGFFGGSQASPGLYDVSADGYSAWPEYGFFLRLVLYGDLTLSADMTPPVIRISSPTPGALFKQDTVAVQWDASDVGLGLDYLDFALDGGASVRLPLDTTTRLLTDLPDGVHSVELLAVDLAGNEAHDTVAFVVDTQPPAVSILSPQKGSYLGTSDVPVIWSASDGGSGVDRIRASVDNGAAVELPGSTSTYTFDGLSDGGHQFTVEAVDGANRSTIATARATVDTTEPLLAVGRPASGAILSSSSIEVAWSAEDELAGIDHFAVNLDGGPEAVLPASSNTYVVPGVTDGPHVVEVTAVDRVGNTESVPVSVIVDTVPPSVRIASPDSGAALPSGLVTIRWTVADVTSGVDRFELRLDRGSTIPISGAETSYDLGRLLEGLPDGDHTVVLRAFDRAGLVAADAITFRVDTQTPFVSILSPTSDLLASDTIAVRWVASDAGTGLQRYELQLDGGPVTPLDPTVASHSLEHVVDGAHTVTLAAFDRAGNRGFSFVQVVVDTTPPAAAITTPVPGSTLAVGTLDIRWTASDATSGVARLELRLDGASATALSRDATGFRFTNLTDGRHFIILSVFDQVGLGTLVSASVTVDTTDPTISVLAPAQGAVVTSKDVVLRLTAADATSGIDRMEATLDGGEPMILADGQASHTFAGLAEGGHTIGVTVFDHAGNSATTATRFSVDTSVLSLSGPYGSAPAAALVVAIAVAAAASIALLRGKRRGPAA